MTTTSPASTGLDAQTLRRDFPILAERVHGGAPLVYLDNAATSQRPRAVIDAIVDCYEHRYANVHRGIHTLAERCDRLYENARERVRSFLGASAPEEVVFTSGTTAAINLVARSYGDAFLEEGDEVLLTVMEHHSNLVPWHQLAERKGVVLRHLPLTDDGLLEWDEVDRLITERTRLVAVTAASNVLGTITPVAEIVRRAHAAGAVVLVDAAQAAPHMEMDVAAWDVDFLAFSGHKMLGPSGIGVLYGKRALLESMPPFFGGGSMIRRVALDRFEPADLPAKYEAGTPPIVPAIGLAAAIEYLDKVGLAAIHRHEQALVRQAHEVLSAVPEVRLLGPSPDRKGGIVSFTLDRIHAHDVAQLLDRGGVAVRAGHHCAQPLHERFGLSASVRASFYLYNTPEDVEALGRGLDEVLRFFRRRRR